MKKTTKYLIMIVLIVLMAPPETAAQNNPVPTEIEATNAFGIKFGRMVSDLWFIGENYSYEIPVKPLTSHTWGVSFIKNISDNKFFNAEIIYMKKGRDRNPNQNHVNAKFFIESPFEAIHINYIANSIAILFNTKGRIALYAGPGIYQSICISRRFDSPPKPRRYDMGIGFTTGIRVLLHPSILAKIEINGTSGFIPVFSKSEIEATGIEKYEGTIALNKTLGGSLSLSYRF